MIRNERQIDAVLHDARQPVLAAVRRNARHQQIGNRHQRVYVLRNADIALPRLFSGDKIMENIGAMHGQRDGYAQRTRQ